MGFDFAAFAGFLAAALVPVAGVTFFLVAADRRRDGRRSPAFVARIVRWAASVLAWLPLASMTLLTVLATIARIASGAAPSEMRTKFGPRGVEYAGNPVFSSDALATEVLAWIWLTSLGSVLVTPGLIALTRADERPLSPRTVRAYWATWLILVVWTFADPGELVAWAM